MKRPITIKVKAAGNRLTTKSTKYVQICVSVLLVCGPLSSFSSEPTGANADDSLKRLLSGNERFVAGKSTAPRGRDLLSRRAALTKDQKPFALILSCSDSRVPPELVFDVGLGDIFVVRTAGQVVDPVDVGSIEYAVEHLGVPLILVMGHQGCGAVTAAVAEATEPGDIANVLKAIAPAVAETKANPGDPIDNAIRANAIDIARQLQGTAPILSSHVQSGKLQIIPARYDLDSGKVELLK